MVSNKFGSASYANQVHGLERDGEDVWQGVFFGRSSSPDFTDDDGAPICSRPANISSSPGRREREKARESLYRPFSGTGSEITYSASPSLGALRFFASIQKARLRQLRHESEARASTFML